MVNVQEIDENIKDIIIKLNNKGYETMYSCGGHVGEETTGVYISVKRNQVIDEFISAGELITVPNGFKLEIQDGVEYYEKIKRAEKNEDAERWFNSLTSEYFHRVTIRTINDVSEMLQHSQSCIDEMVDRLTQWVELLPNIR